MAGKFVLRSEGDVNNPTAARLYGLGLTGGRLVFYLTNAVGDRTAFLAILCQGARFRGDLACSKAVRVYYAGFELPEFDANGARQWKFHKGHIAGAPDYKAIQSVDAGANTWQINNHGMVSGDYVSFHGRGTDTEMPAGATIAFHSRRMVWKVDDNTIKVLAQTSGAPDENLAYDITNSGQNLSRIFAYKSNNALYDSTEQGRPHFFSNLNFTFSGLTYIEVLLPSNLSNGEDEPSNLKVIVEGKEVYDIANDGSGNVAFNTAVKTAVPNNSLVAIDAAHHDGKMPLTRFHAPTFLAWRDRCDGVIGWAGGNEIPAPRTDWTLTNMSYDATTNKFTKTGGTNQWAQASAYSETSFTAEYASAEAKYTGSDFALHFTATKVLNQLTKQGLVCENGILKYNYQGAHHVITVLGIGDTVKIAYENGIFVIYKNSIPMPMVANTYQQLFSTFYFNYDLKITGSTIEGMAQMPSGVIGTPRQIPRFRGHIAAVEGIAVADLFESMIHLSGGTSWADVDGQIRIATEPDRTPVYTFSRDNTFKITTKNRALEDTPNYFRFVFRDSDDLILARKYANVDRKERRSGIGGRLIQSEIHQYGVMTQSQMERIGEVRARLEADLGVGFTVEAFLDSIEVCKGSFVNVVLPETGFTEENPALCMVIDERTSFSDVESRVFELQIITPDFYSDTAHGAVAPASTNVAIAAYRPPQLVQSLTLFETSEPLPSGQVVPSISGLVTFGQGIGQRGRIFTKVLKHKIANVSYDYTTNTFTLQDGAMPSNVTGLSLTSLGNDLPFGASNDLPYYVVEVAGNSFKLSKEPSGAPDVFEDNGTGQLRLYQYAVWNDTGIDVRPNEAAEASFEIFPAIKSETLVRVQTFSRAEATLPAYLHTTRILSIVGDVEPPTSPQRAWYEYDGVRLRVLWERSPTVGVRGYVVKDEAERTVAEVDANTTSFVQTAQTENVTRRIYSVSSSGILSANFARVTFIRPPSARWINLNGYAYNSDGKLVKTSATGWNAGAVFNQAVLTDLVPARMTVTPSDNTTFKIVGFTSILNPVGLGDFEFAIYFLNDGTVQYYYNNGEEQAQIALYEAGSEFVLEVEPNPEEVSQINIIKVTYPNGIRSEEVVHTFNADFSRKLPFFIAAASYTQGDVLDINLTLEGDIIPTVSTVPAGTANEVNASYDAVTGTLENDDWTLVSGASFPSGLAAYQEGGWSFKINGAMRVGLAVVDASTDADDILFALDAETIGDVIRVMANGVELSPAISAWDETAVWFIGRENGVPVIRKNGRLVYNYTAASDTLKNSALILDVTFHSGEAERSYLEDVEAWKGYVQARVENEVPTMIVDELPATFVGENRADDIPVFGGDAPENGDVLMFNGEAYVAAVLEAANIPNLDASKITSGIFSHERLGTGGGGTTKFLREDSTWQSVSATVAAAGDNGEIQFNSADAFSSSPNLVFNGNQFVSKKQALFNPKMNEATASISVTPDFNSGYYATTPYDAIAIDFYTGNVQHWGLYTTPKPTVNAFRLIDAAGFEPFTIGKFGSVLARINASATEPPYGHKIVADASTAYYADHIYDTLQVSAQGLTAYALYGTGDLRLFRVDDGVGNEFFHIYRNGNLYAPFGKLLLGAAKGSETGGKLQVRSTSEQVRLEYDATNRFSTTVSSSGTVNFTLAGTSPYFQFNNDAVMNVADLTFNNGTKGVILKDRTTGDSYRLLVDNGVLDIESV